MTNLEAFKTKMLDRHNKIMADDEYRDFLESQSIVSSDTFDNSKNTALMLAKAELLESIVANPARWNSYTQGKIREDLKPDLILQEAKSIRRRFTVIA